MKDKVTNLRRNGLIIEHLSVCYDFGCVSISYALFEASDIVNGNQCNLCCGNMMSHTDGVQET